MTRGREVVSMTLSKEVVEKLNMFKNKSKLVDDILSSLLLNLSKEEVIELIMSDDDIPFYLIRKKCRELMRSILVGRGRLVRGYQDAKR